MPLGASRKPPGGDLNRHLAGEAGEAEDRMQLDRVRSDARLSVLEIEERDAGDATRR